MLRVATLNLNYYIGKHGPWEVRKKLIRKELHEKNPDIIAFQAVANHPDLYNGKDQALQLCEELNGFQSHYFQEAQTSSDGLKQGSAVISKFPMLEKSIQKLSLKPGLDDQNHRIVIRTSFERPEGRLDVYNAHFSWVQEQAVTNVEETTRFIEKGNSDALLAGDLNTPPGSTAFLPFQQAGFADAWQKLYHNKEGYTFESNNPSLRIDYFWVSPSLISKLNSVVMISPPPDSAARLSDHLGLMLGLNNKD
jgi:endonuclease/exonuclease/phosphatase family metal-dependent hydrolase